MSPRASGRPPATTHAAIERAAFELFEERGFDATTMDEIAAALGIGRRTLFRYYPSKNDILWGQFTESLAHFRGFFARTPAATPLWDGICEALVDFNNFDPAAMPQHRRRMRLLLRTPTLLAHSELRYAAWRSVVAEHVADRLGQDPADPQPRLAGRVALAVAVSAYDRWLEEPDASLPDLIRESARGVGALLHPEPGAGR